MKYTFRSLIAKLYVHFAYSVIFDVIAVEKLNWVVKFASVYHPLKVYHGNTGFDGCVAVLPWFTVWDGTAVHLFESNVTVYGHWAIVHFAYYHVILLVLFHTYTWFAKLLFLYHHQKVYPAFVGVQSLVIIQLFVIIKALFHPFG